jgi:hypothetical protein
MSTQTQSIIVYRNPLEQQFYESDALFPILAAMASFIIVFLVMRFVFGLISPKISAFRGYRSQDTADKVMLALSGIIAFQVLHHLYPLW